MLQYIYITAVYNTVFYMLLGKHVHVKIPLINGITFSVFLMSDEHWHVS
jgi:hypothetical protein